MKKTTLILTFLLIIQFSFSANQVDTITVFATKMKKEVKSVVVLPDNYNKKKKYPVVYLLHGYSDNYSKWVKTVPAIKSLSTKHQMILVCPDGGYSSWFMDSSIDSTYQYESFIVGDLLK